MIDAKNMLTESKLIKFLDYAYDKSVEGIGVPGIDTAHSLAESYLKTKGTLKEQINCLIRWQNTKSATSGFLTGLGGVMTLPVVIPVNISGILFLQVRMVVSIAIMCGQDIRDDRVRTIVYTCLVGNAAKDILKEAGIQIGQKLTTSAIKSISKEIIVKINKAVGFRLMTKTGSTGVINLSKFVPVVGGIVGGGFDAITTNIIGNYARDTFLSLADNYSCG
ncbi:EcsC family protein [Escherichia coli]|uniref:EcsC family protein n=2 Tax=Escherichia coli TaxID=562 RepID=A0A0Q0WHF1_ECOLX|nr:EcsC family protein [Escherichia coli]EFA8565673.1 EcsC family protein [Escherichia coli O157]EES0914757.1 EcsC family protein [Escherichia coli]EEU9537744.1 EcsC family protein [Escherichia coli]EEV5626666.1 EcsC family protein [Escherichia coli]EEW5972754.1 EcsC family protein [Escherichia coli]